MEAITDAVGRHRYDPHDLEHDRPWMGCGMCVEDLTLLPALEV